MNNNRFFTLETESRNQFYQIPKVFMLEESKYFNMSAMAKLLYGVLADRNSLSIKNGWVDDDRRVFFLFKQDEIGKMVGVKDTKTVRKYLKELETYGLLHRERQGLNKADKLYLLQVEVAESQSYQLMGKNPLSGEGNNPVQEEGNSPTNNTNINNTDFSNNKKIREGEPSFPVLSDEDETIKTKEIIKPVIIPKEAISDLDKRFIGRLRKERTLYDYNFDDGLYYNAFIESIVATQIQDNVDVLEIEQYPYFLNTLRNKIYKIQWEEKKESSVKKLETRLLGWD